MNAFRYALMSKLHCEKLAKILALKIPMRIIQKRPLNQNRQEIPSCHSLYELQNSTSHSPITFSIILPITIRW